MSTEQSGENTSANPNVSTFADLIRQMSEAKIYNLGSVSHGGCGCDSKTQFIELMIGYLQEMKKHKHDSNEYSDQFNHLKHLMQVFCTVGRQKCLLKWKTESDESDDEVC